jgi:hypothetical protein
MSRGDRASGNVSASARLAPGGMTRRQLWTGVAQAGAAWGLSRIALMAFMLLYSWATVFDRPAQLRDGLQWGIDRFWGGDAGHFARIARLGYPKDTCCDQAFLPGYPMLIRAMSVLTGRDYRLAALLVTAVMGVIAAGLLWLLTADRIAGRRRSVDAASSSDVTRGSVTSGDDARAAGFRAVTYLMVAPYGVFLVVGYSEATFLVFAMAAWLAASRRNWWLAGPLMAATVSIRINGLFVVAALALMYVLQLRADGRWRPRRDLLAFGFPVLALAWISAWLHQSTGSWDAWREAEERGWNRQTAWPWDGLAIGWHEVTSHKGPHLLLASLAAFVTVVIGLLLVAVFAWLRRWPEALLMVLSVTVLVCSTTFVSAPRYALSWFPAFILAAELTGRQRWRWLHQVLVIGCLPVAAVVALIYSQQGWVA